MPLGAVRLPAWDMGWPYLARFSAVSGTGPLVTVVLVKVVETSAPAVVAAGVVTVVDVADTVAASADEPAGTPIGTWTFSWYCLSSDGAWAPSQSPVTNGPVPDTAENRAKYGQPMSHAGKRTAAKGN